MSCLGLAFHPSVLGPGIVLGVASAGLYGLLSVSLVMTYRGSRTIGFVHGGLALFGTFVYWWLTSPAAQINGTARMGQVPAAALVTVMGAAIGVVYGFTVTGRMASWPRVRITTYSLGWLLGLGALIITWFNEQVQGASNLPLRSLFGRRTYRFFGAVVTIHQVVTVAILATLMVLLTYVLLRTRIGIYIRAIADDVEAGDIVGIPTRAVAIGVWTFSGALAGLGGALIVPMTALTELAVLFVLMRSLAAAILGGFDSLPLALGGALIFGMVESVVGGGVFGPVSSGAREVILMTLLFGGILLLARRRGTMQLGGA